MAAETLAKGFAKNNLDWQIQQFWRQVGEWIEVRFPRLRSPNVPNAPNWFPGWWLEAAFWMAVIAIALWLIWLLYQWLSPYLGAQFQTAKMLNRRADERSPEKTVSGWMQQVQEFQRQGNYREACRALYMATLQRLNDAKLVPHQSSRTDREYWTLVKLLPQAQAYQTLLRTHEQLCFGNTDISAEAFNRCQAAYREIEQSASGN